MLKLGRDPDLAEEAIAAEGGGKLREQNLDRYLTTVADVIGQKHDGHAAPPELPSHRIVFGQREAETLERIANQRITQRSVPR